MPLTEQRAGNAVRGLPDVDDERNLENSLILRRNCREALGNPTVATFGRRGAQGDEDRLTNPYLNGYTSINSQEVIDRDADSP